MALYGRTQHGSGVALSKPNPVQEPTCAPPLLCRLCRACRLSRAIYHLSRAISPMMTEWQLAPPGERWLQSDPSHTSSALCSRKGQRHNRPGSLCSRAQRGRAGYSPHEALINASTKTHVTRLARSH